MSYDRMVLAELKKLVMEELETVVGIITSPHVEEFPAYKMHAGRIMAYRKVLELFEEAKDNVEKRE